jgi:plastocyanin
MTLKLEQLAGKLALALPAIFILSACTPQAASTPEAQPTDAPEPAAELMDEPAADMETPANSVSVVDQALAEGGVVTIPVVISAAPGWLVIHADNGGSPGLILGMTPVTDGENLDVVVELAGEGVTETLYAMLHIDAGTAGAFEFPDGADVPALDSDGSVVAPSFDVILPAAALSGQVFVTIRDNSFSERQLRITVGTTVTWRHNAIYSHTVTADGGQFNSGRMENGGVFSFTFTEPGVYPYHCDLHGGSGGAGMSGVITVVES